MGINEFLETDESLSAAHLLNPQVYWMLSHQPLLKDHLWNAWNHLWSQSEVQLPAAVCPEFSNWV